MRASIRHFQRSVDSLLTDSQVELPSRSRARLVFFIIGLLLSGTLVLRRIATTHAHLTPHATCAASHERRLRRVLNDPHLNWERSYARVVRRLLAKHRPQRWLLIVDESGHSDRLRVLSAALFYRGRAIPLAWLCWQAQTPQSTSYWSRCATLLKLVASVLPKEAKVVLVADRAFGCPAFIDLVAEQGWQWLVRVQGQTRFCDHQGQQRQMRELLTERGKRYKARGQLFKDAGWRDASVLAVWGVGHREALLLASSLGPSWELLALYRKRSAIEALFRDWKSSGWQWEASQVRTVQRQAQLVMMLAFASLLTLMEGTQAAAEEQATAPRLSRRRTWAGSESLFQLGREAFFRRLWQNQRSGLRWELSELDSPNWSAQSRAFHSPLAPRQRAAA